MFKIERLCGNVVFSFPLPHDQSVAKRRLWHQRLAERMHAYKHVSWTSTLPLFSGLTVVASLLMTTIYYGSDVNVYLG